MAQPSHQTKTQSLPSLGEFKALDTSSKIRACEEIKSQMNFSQIQGCLFLALFPVCTCGTRGLHAELQHSVSQLGSSLGWCLHLAWFQPEQKTAVGCCRAPGELGQAQCAS